VVTIMMHNNTKLSKNKQDGCPTLLKTSSEIDKLELKNSLAYGTVDVKIFYQHGAPTKLSKPGGRGTMSLGQFNFGGGQWVVTIMIHNNTKLSSINMMCAAKHY